MPDFRIRGSRRTLEQVEATITAADLAAAAAAFVAGLESGAPTFPVTVNGSAVVAGTCRAAKRVRVEEDNIS